MSDAKYEYELTLKITERGAVRTFSATDSFDIQNGFREAVARDVVRATTSTMNDSPFDYDFVAAFEGGFSKLRCLAECYKHWSGEEDLDNCVDIAVDVERLVDCGEDDKGDGVKKSILRAYMRRAGVGEKVDSSR